MKHRIVKQIKEVEVGQFFVCDYRGSNIKLQENPTRKNVKMLLKNGIIDVIEHVEYGSFLIDNHLNENKSLVYMVEPVWEDGRLDFVFKTA